MSEIWQGFVVEQHRTKIHWFLGKTARYNAFHTVDRAGRWPTDASGETSPDDAQ